jgi:hypothetical protein
VQGRQINRIVNNSSLDFYRALLEDTLIRRNAQDITGNHNPYTNVTVHEYAGHVAAEESKVASAAGQVSAQHEQFREQQERQLKALNRQAQAVAAEQRRAEIEAWNKAVAAGRMAGNVQAKLERLTVMEAAARQGYEPQLQYDTVGLWENQVTDFFQKVEVSSSVWKLDLKVFDGSARAKILQADSERLVALTPRHQGASWEFLVLDHPGSFLVVVETEGASDYTLEVSQFGN